MGPAGRTLGAPLEVTAYKRDDKYLGSSGNIFVCANYDVEPLR